MKTYLVQRAKKENRDFKVGIDSIIYLDYMGASEFECGALPKSLKKIRANIADYVYLDITIDITTKNKTLTVFCHDRVKEEVEQMILDLISREMQTKEYTALDDQFNDGYFKGKVDFWWDINNDLMFWMKDDTNFENEFREIIINKPK